MTPPHSKRSPDSPLVKVRNPGRREKSRCKFPGSEFEQFKSPHPGSGVCKVEWLARIVTEGPHALENDKVAVSSVTGRGPLRQFSCHAHGLWRRVNSRPGRGALCSRELKRRPDRGHF